MLAIGLAICACMLVSGGRWGVLRTFKWDHAKSSSGDPIWRSDLEIWRCETAGIELAFVDVVGHAYGTVQSREPSMSCRSLVPRATRLTKAGRDKSVETKLSTPITMLHTDTPQTHSTEFIVSV